MQASSSPNSEDALEPTRSSGLIRAKSWMSTLLSGKKWVLVAALVAGVMTVSAAIGTCVYFLANSRSAPQLNGTRTSNTDNTNNIRTNTTLSNTTVTNTTLLNGTTVSQPSSTSNAPAPIAFMGYYPNWAMYSRGSVSSLNLTNVSVLYWAFWTVNADGSIRSVDQWADFQVNGNGSIYELNQIVKPKYPGLKTMLTIGGWTLSSNFSAVAASEQARATFAQSCLDAVGKYGFDGIEIDWEFPSPPNDPTNLASLLTTLRSKLTPEGHLISLAVSATGSEYVSSSSIACIAQQTDWLNILAYDLAGSWDAYTGFLAPLERIQGDPAGSRWSLSEVVDKYVSSGVDRSKLALGVAMYGRSWLVKSTAGAGLYKPCVPQKQSAVGSCDPPRGDYLDTDTTPTGVWTYSGLRRPGSPLSPGPFAPFQNWSRTLWPPTQSPTLLGPGPNDTFVFIAYEDPESVRAKAKFAREKGLRAVFAWEISLDYGGELMKDIVEGATGM